MFLLESCTQGLTLPVVGLSRCIQAITDLTFLIEFVPDISPLPSIEIIQLLADAAPSESGIITERVTTMRTFLGGDDDHTVGTTGTVDGCGGYIFQYLNALDITGVEEGQGIECGITALGTGTVR